MRTFRMVMKKSFEDSEELFIDCGETPKNRISVKKTECKFKKKRTAIKYTKVHVKSK